MGRIKDEFILVSSHDTKRLHRIRRAAVAIFDRLVTPIRYTVVNKEGHFMIAPDGSKEGWETSNEYDGKRKLFMTIVENEEYVRVLYVSHDDETQEVKSASLRKAQDLDLV